jgi:hypothetical protein
MKLLLVLPNVLPVLLMLLSLGQIGDHGEAVVKHVEEVLRKG